MGKISVVISEKDIYDNYHRFPMEGGHRYYIQERFVKEHGLMIEDWGKISFKRTDSDINLALEVSGELGQGLITCGGYNASKEESR